MYPMWAGSDVMSAEYDERETTWYLHSLNSKAFMFSLRRFPFALFYIWFSPLDLSCYIESEVLCSK